MKHLYSALYSDDCHPFNHLEGIESTSVATTPEQLERNDAALIIWGGADINPAYYGHPMHSTTHPGGQRDRLEWALMQRAIEKGMPIIAVCRGAQMGCAASGGFLIQNVRGHMGTHSISTYDGQEHTVNSIHHQMLVPDDTDHELVAWSSDNLAPEYGYMDDKVWTPPAGWREPEFVYFTKTRIYAIQWHPEMMPLGATATKYVLNYINRKERETSDRKLVGSSCDPFARSCC